MATPPIPAPASTHTGPFMHFCQECGDFAPFGHKVAGKDVWYCKGHDPCGGLGTPGAPKEPRK